MHIKEKRKMAYPVLVRTHKTSLVCQPAGPQRPTLPPAHAHHWDAVWPEETTCTHVNTARDNIADKRIISGLCHEKQHRAQADVWRTCIIDVLACLMASPAPLYDCRSCSILTASVSTSLTSSHTLLSASVGLASAEERSAQNGTAIHIYGWI